MDVKDWYHIVRQISDDMLVLDPGPATYFVVDFTLDEIEAAVDFLTQKHGWCPPVYPVWISLAWITTGIMRTY